MIPLEIVLVLKNSLCMVTMPSPVLCFVSDMVEDSVPVLWVWNGLPQEMCGEMPAGNKLQSSEVSRRVPWARTSLPYKLLAIGSAVSAQLTHVPNTQAHSQVYVPLSLSSMIWCCSADDDAL